MTLYLQHENGVACLLSAFHEREISSAGSEHLPYKQGVTGSNPVSPTKVDLQRLKM